MTLIVLDGDQVDPAALSGRVRLRNCSIEKQMTISRRGRKICKNPGH
jgi:hypothetical protein